MVLLGFVIEKDFKAFNYISRFISVFSNVRASVFGKKRLFEEFNHKIKMFDDRIVFAYSGKTSAFKLMRELLWFALVLIGVISFVLGYSNLVPTIRTILNIALILGLLIQLAFYWTYSKYNFWSLHTRTMAKKKFGLKKNKKKLLSDTEIFNCFVMNVKPLFKGETGDDKDV